MCGRVSRGGGLLQHLSSATLTNDNLSSWRNFIRNSRPSGRKCLTKSNHNNNGVNRTEPKKNNIHTLHKKSNSGRGFFFPECLTSSLAFNSYLYFYFGIGVSLITSLGGVWRCLFSHHTKPIYIRKEKKFPYLEFRPHMEFIYIT